MKGGEVCMRKAMLAKGKGALAWKLARMNEKLACKLPLQEVHQNSREMGSISCHRLNHHDCLLDKIHTPDSQFENIQ